MHKENPHVESLYSKGPGLSSFFNLEKAHNLGDQFTVGPFPEEKNNILTHCSPHVIQDYNLFLMHPSHVQAE
jgi:hypothetical protein